MNIDNRYSDTLSYIQSCTQLQPRVCIILGSGLGDLVNHLTIELSIPYSKIPHFPVSTVEGHSGNLLFASIYGISVVIMQGRFHYYEGYSMQQITYPIRIMKLLGVTHLFVSNATGGLNPQYRTGDLMILRDHINFFPEHPLRGINDDAFGVRFPDMSQVYSLELITKAQQIAQELQIPIHTGVYIGSSGPSLETPAEYKMFRLWGADVTGMSTVPEVIVAHHCGIVCFGISIITNESADAQNGIVTTHADVQKNASLSQPRMTAIFLELIRRIF
ncbi:MAG TPA: purine-nucleoside phosphorylase [Bacteroidales bacterium]|nr:purine-nucleoside phosphorylase [Bacteroidales bacterium]